MRLSQIERYELLRKNYLIPASNLINKQRAIKLIQKTYKRYELGIPKIVYDNPADGLKKIEHSIIQGESHIIIRMNRGDTVREVFVVEQCAYAIYYKYKPTCYKVGDATKYIFRIIFDLFCRHVHKDKTFVSAEFAKHRVVKGNAKDVAPPKQTNRPCNLPHVKQKLTKAKPNSIMVKRTSRQIDFDD